MNKYLNGPISWSPSWWKPAAFPSSEVPNELFETVQAVNAQLDDLGYQVQEICQCGLVVLAGGKKPGKCILIRGDMDALPMPEDTGLEFSSENPGAMHACGHDLHMAMLLGAAKLLKEHEDEIEGTVKICFQPNEETFGGAKAMIEAGVLENPHVDAAFAIHVGSMADVGTLDYGKGLTMGSADGFSIHVKGKGCHGAAPNSGISPINIGVHIYLALPPGAAGPGGQPGRAVHPHRGLHALRRRGYQCDPLGRRAQRHHAGL